jgi:glycyl-tRNA synthetase beta chain
MGSFEEDYLSIPSEIIRLTIKTNQKCFVTRKQGEETLSNRFILVSNVEATDGGKEIIHGNGKVVRARLSDALHFWKRDQGNLPDLETLEASAKKFGLDLRKPLDQRMAKLDALHVTFHAKIGTQGERVTRIRTLAAEIGKIVNADPLKVSRAAALAKADLRTEVVGEFPELQGAMGKKYALLQGEDEPVAAALEDHYKPQGPTDRVPTDGVAITIALADKIDTLVWFWRINEKPTGSKDPFALRRAALGSIRLLLERGIRASLIPLFRSAFRSEWAVAIASHEASIRLFELKIQQDNERFDHERLVQEQREAIKYCKNYLADGHPKTIEEEHELAINLLSFFHDRLKVYLRDQGARYDLIDAVVTSEADDLLMIARRVEALTAFITSEDGKNLLVGTKRATQILAAEEKKGTVIADGVSEKLFRLDAEKELFAAIAKASAEASTAIASEDFRSAMEALSKLRAPVDRFFDDVLVNDEDAAIRANRLALLRLIREATGTVADFSKIAG